MNEILAIILTTTYSSTQLKHRLRLLKSNLLKTFFGQAGEDLPAIPQDLNWLQSLPDNFYQQFNANNVYKIFSDLEDQTHNLPILTLYLTFEPDEATLAQISTFTRKLFSSNLLLDIKLDPNLIAGTALVWNGVYKDYSLRNQLTAKKTQLWTEFRKFLR